MQPSPLKTGLITGAISSVILLLMYAAGPSAFASFWSMLVWLLPVIILLYFAFQARKSVGGYMTYGEAFKYLFLSSVVITIVTTVVSMVLFMVVDPEFMPQVKELAIEQQVERLEGFGAPDASVEEAVNSMEKNFDAQSTWGGRALGGLFSLLFWLVISAICALFVKKNKPEFAP